MERHRPRIGWPLVPSGLMLGIWVVGLFFVLWRGSAKSGPGAADSRNGRAAAANSGRVSKPPSAPVDFDDPRLKSLRRAAETWRRSIGKTRRVIDQVCLVPDVSSFLDAIAFWDEDHYFPILIDSPAWSLPFLRAFRPARVVRYTSAESTAATADPSSGRNGDIPSASLWQGAIRSLTRAWSPPRGSIAPLGSSEHPAAQADKRRTRAGHHSLREPGIRGRNRTRSRTFPAGASG